MPLLYPIFLLIAAVYATAGFGGGSSYLAVLALWSVPTDEMRLIALTCNIIVAGGGVLHFARAGELPWRAALPLVLASVPCAYLGGLVELPREQFVGLLAVVLLVAGGAMLLRKERTEITAAGDTTKPGAKGRLTYLPAAGLGGALGFLAGLVSIGGGIFLSPVLFLTRWDTPRRIAAVTSLFILLNSVAGLGGRLSSSPTSGGWLSFGCALSVLVGGQLGTRLTLSRLPPATIRRTAALLILLVGLRLLYQTLPNYL